jgi:hypothetical protein
LVVAYRHMVAGCVYRGFAQTSWHVAWIALGGPAIDAGKEFLRNVWSPIFCTLFAGDDRCVSFFSDLIPSPSTYRLGLWVLEAVGLAPVDLVDHCL